jgi:hypothetical protein
MLLAGLLASVELGLNRVLRLDSTALPRLAHLSGKVIASTAAARRCKCSSCPATKA